MSKLMLTPQAATDLSAMSERDVRFVRQGLFKLQINPAIGLKLWGYNDLYVYQTITDARIMYRLYSTEIQVLSITSQSTLLNVPAERQRICAVVLAAGHTAYADTMSYSNLVTPFLLAGVDNLILVVGDHADQARLELKHKNVTIVVNSDFDNELSKSLRCGLKMLPVATSAIMLSLGNRPFISSEVVSHLIQAYCAGGSRVVVPVYSQMRGHPVIFDVKLLPELFKVRGNSGGREVIKQYTKELTQVNVGDAGVLKRIWLN
jgi:molybdenum cofactor cytidylyltransferase